jgi:hypothetical protein
VFGKTSFLVWAACVLVMSPPVWANPEGERGDTTLRDYMANLDYSCQRDSDCTIKDVRNCCGYYPKCVNISARVQPDLVRRECQRLGLAGVCGFPSIKSCECRSRRCEPKVGRP